MVIKSAILPEYSTIYSAELIAIYESLKHVHLRRGKFAICSDSLSSLKSITNINNVTHYITEIRNLLIARHPNIKLIWVPGHCGIKGNELADLNAREASTFPLITTPNYNPMDWNKYIIKQVIRQYKLNLMNDSSIWYTNLNREMTKICSFLRSKTGYNRIDIIKFV